MNPFIFFWILVAVSGLTNNEIQKCILGELICKGDNHKNCCYWASIGECKRNPSYMKSICQDSCGPSGCAPHVTSPPRRQVYCGNPPIAPIEHVSKRVKRVVGGQPARAGSWPWIVRIGFDHFCDGSLISDRWILTAAHCVKNRNVNYLWVRAGFYDITDTAQGVSLEVEKIVAHSRYHLTWKKVNPYDIALLKLKTPVTWTDRIRPVCIPRDHSSVTDGKMMTIAGWGSTEAFGPTSAILYQTAYPVVSILFCQLTYEDGKVLRNGGQFCAGSGGYGGSCKGDSGGPAVRKVSGSWYQYGIVSFGSRFCDYFIKPGKNLSK